MAAANSSLFTLHSSLLTSHFSSLPHPLRHFPLAADVSLPDLELAQCTEPVTIDVYDAVLT